jgi:hypothetical protein
MGSSLLLICILVFLLGLRGRRLFTGRMKLSILETDFGFGFGFDEEFALHLHWVAFIPRFLLSV